jgi:Rieske Fe-S protein
MADDVERSQTGTVSRRGFIGWALGVGAGFVALVAAIPAAGMFLGTSSGQTTGFVEVADVASLPEGEPTGITFVQQTTDAYLHETLPHSVWVTKRSAADVVVLSPVCPHLGCQVAWDKQKKQYVCPCHNSVFAPDGKLLSGPAPRSMDTLPSKVEGGKLMVQWMDYKPGIPTQESV